jgi:hypothetical protein
VASPDTVCVVCCLSSACELCHGVKVYQCIVPWSALASPDVEAAPEAEEEDEDDTENAEVEDPGEVEGCCVCQRCCITLFEC